MIATLMGSIQSKKEEELSPIYNTFEDKFNQVSTGDTDDDVMRMLGQPSSVYEEDKLIPRGPVEIWEYIILSREYTLSFNKDELVEDNPEWRVYARSAYNPEDAEEQEYDGYNRIMVISIVLSCIYLGFTNIRKIFWKIR